MPNPAPNSDAADPAFDALPHVLAYVRDTPWAILPERLAVIQDLIAFRAGGGRMTPAEVRAAIGAGRAPVAAAQLGRVRVGGGVAVLALRGVIAHRIESVNNISGPGGTSTEGFAQRFREAMADDSVTAIVIDIDSPGGAVAGVDELATEIRKARGDKPIVAVANSLATSAAYWIGSSADELFITPSGVVGSIGIFGAHEDQSALLEKTGVKTTLVFAGRFKIEGNPFEPLSDDARRAMQDRVDNAYGMFVDAVAQGRGVKSATVRDGFGQGRVVDAKQAVDLGMADGIATLDEVLARFAPAKSQRQSRAMSARRLEMI